MGFCGKLKALGILINLVERCAATRDRLLRAPVPPQPDDLLGASGSALSALIHLFISKEESARLEEARTDEILDGKAHSGEAAAGAAGAAALHPSAGAGTRKKHLFNSVEPDRCR